MNTTHTTETPMSVQQRLEELDARVARERTRAMKLSLINPLVDVTMDETIAHQTIPAVRTTEDIEDPRVQMLVGRVLSVEPEDYAIITAQGFPMEVTHIIVMPTVGGDLEIVYYHGAASGKHGYGIRTKSHPAIIQVTSINWLEAQYGIDTLVEMFRTLDSVRITALMAL